MAIRVRLGDWKNEIEQELKQNILNFWMKHGIDDVHGGFIGAMKNDLTIIPEYDKGLVLNARLLWTFASAYRIYRDPAYLEIADRAYAYLTDHFWDRENGGLYWMLNFKGEPSERKKQIYGQAFFIYAIAEYVRAKPNKEALNWAILTFELIEKYSYDPVYKGYIEALDGNWEETSDLSLSGTDLNEKKSMNTHLHILEAYTNLYRVWPDASLTAKLKELIEVTIDHIVDTESGHFLLFFDEAWGVKSHEISYGHDIEGSWLLMEAAETLGDEKLLLRVKKVALDMAQAVYEAGLDTDGAVINEADQSGWIDTDKHWWPQAEAVVGFLNAYQMSGEEHYLQAAYGAWRFIDDKIVDKDNGEWYWLVDREGQPSDERMKIDPWKCPYHNGRMGFEIVERVHKMEGEK
ncbi:AGE family epimerase/isomerase [Paenibacillus sp. NEAU-GSW1]|uniref:AGE family epimerase/isomerase n=1 Tax=Paenibacillus sp. NEAU-GSW1 TaxID=2682486 RepID=UPI0012E1C7AB|nr:AGE family epimerase/isomerase [Paenibacillus sp. NEAU-GSW1]MUT66613.1 N-acyl-D-glucosamine 2-epimerase [Paenibacillus sp. NEAU-GSW1]